MDRDEASGQGATRERGRPVASGATFGGLMGEEVIHPRVYARDALALRGPVALQEGRRVGR